VFYAPQIGAVLDRWPLQSLHDLSLVAKLVFKVFPLCPQQSHTGAQQCYPFLDLASSTKRLFRVVWSPKPSLGHRLFPSIDVPMCVHSQAGRIQLFGTALPNAAHVAPSRFLATSMLYSNTQVAGLLHPATNHRVHCVLLPHFHATK
jgi:hypothetical protein